MEALARRPPQPLPSRTSAGWRRIAPQRSTHEPRRRSLATRRDARALRCPCQPRDARRSPSTATSCSCQTLDVSSAMPSSPRSNLRRSRCVARTDGLHRRPVLASTATCAALAGQRPPRAVAISKKSSMSANASPPLHHVARHAARCSLMPAPRQAKTHSDFSERLACEPTLPSPWSKEIPTRCCEVWCRFRFRTRHASHIKVQCPPKEKQ